jgi:hypothetical protein
MSRDPLYPLLPAIYRIRDEAAGQPLQALLAVLESELDVLETDIGDLYDNWFIETCAEWVVPYIGDLLDVQELYVENARLATFGRQERRAFVANTLAYRRRKGTAPVLEQLTRDLTGWSARVVEVFDRLTTTAQLDHPRSGSGWVDLRQTSQSDRVGTPFEQLAAYTPEIRRGARGRYSLRNINLFLWRLSSYPIYRGTPRAILGSAPTADNPRCYTFDPIGGSFALFNQPQPELEITRLADEMNVPGKLRRAALTEELQARADAAWQGHSLDSPSYFGTPNPPVIQVFINGQPRPIPTDEILIAPLENAPSQADGNPWKLPVAGSLGELLPKVVAIDPEQGRLAFLDGTVPSRVEVSYAYGFSGDVGSGSYEHNGDLEGLDIELADPHPLLTWDIEQDNAPDANPLATAVEQWNRTVLAWEDLRRQAAVPLARLVLPDDRIVSVSPESRRALRPAFSPGILKGLAVSASVGSTEISVNPGVAVDDQGRVMAIDLPQTIALTHPQYDAVFNTIATSVRESVTVGVVLAYRAAQTDPNWQLHILPEAALSSYPLGRFILLATVTIAPQTKEIQEDRDVSDLLRFAPGLVTGFTVVLNPGNPEVSPPPPPPGIRRDRSTPPLTAVVTAGMAVDSRGRAIVLDQNYAVDLRVHQGQTVWLVAAYQRRLGQPHWKITVVPTADIGNFPDSVYQTLAHVQVPQVTTRIEPSPAVSSLAVSSLAVSSLAGSSGPAQPLRSRQPNIQLPMQVNPGIVKGLTVTAKVGEAGVTVAPGIAIDSQSNILESEIHYRVNLRRYARQFANQTVLLVMVAVDAPRPPRWRMQVIAPSDPIAMTAIALARITLNRWGQVASLSASVRQICHPGIVRGLTVRSINPAQVEIAAGIALTRDRLITLDRPCQVDVSAYPGHTLTLFIGDRRSGDQSETGGSSMQILTPKLGEGLHHIGIVSQEPANAKTGVITVRDHRTYTGDLTLIIPTLRQLWLRSAGTRPHLLGNLTVQGLDSSLGSRLDLTPDSTPPESQAQPGAFTLDGWLVEGQVTVTAGQLKQLNVLHSTLVPQAGGLRVESAIAPPPPDDADVTNWLLARVLYWLNQIQRIVGLGLEAGRRSPQENLTALLDLARQQVGRVFTTAQQVFQAEEGCLPCLDDVIQQRPWTCFGEEETTADSAPPTNRDLSITLYRSICGAIHLPDTVPTLRAIDSIIDQVTATEGAAITAPGTDVDFTTTTVFGSTTASSLEASSSIFTGKVITQRRQIGCLRFCSLPENSHTPRRYRCQPDLVLSEALDRLPAPITALAVDPNTGWMWAGTAGNGIFRSQNDGQTWTLQSPANWHVTTLFAQTKLGKGTLSSQDRLVVGLNTAFPVELRVGDLITAARQTQQVQQLHVTISAAFVPDLSLGVPFSIQRAIAGRIASVGTSVTGTDTAFPTELRVGDRLRVGDQSRTITEIASATKLTLDRAFPTDLPPGTPCARRRAGPGRLTSDGTLVTNGDRAFNSIIQVGDRLIAAGQARTVTGFAATTVEPFQPPLPPETVFSVTRSGSGTLTSEGTTVTGQGTRFLQELNVGDAISVVPPVSNNPQVSSDPQVPNHPQIRPQIRTVVAFSANNPETGIVVDAAFDPPLANATFTIPGQTVLYVGLTGGEMVRSVDGGETWVPLHRGDSDGEINTDIVAFAVHAQTGQGTISSRGTTVTGSRTQFSQLAVGDTLMAAGQVRTITSIASKPLSPTRQAASKPAPAKPVTQSNTVLTVNAPWLEDLPPGTAFRQPVLLVATAGDGVFRGSGLPTREWTDTNAGLGYRHLTGLAVSAQGRVFAGTAGGGMFRLQGPAWQWTEVNAGLRDRAITVVAIDAEGRLFVGTQSGQMFRSTDHGNLWTPLGNRGGDLPSLLTYIEAGTGTLTSVGTQVTGQNTQFQQEFPVGSTLRVQNQARTVTAVSSDTGLFLNTAFDADLTTATPLIRRLRQAEGTAQTVLAYSAVGTGTLTSVGTRVTGQDTQFFQVFRVGSTLRVQNQVRMVTAVLSDTDLIVNAAFDTDVTAAPFSRNLLLVGTGNGTIWQSIDNGNLWDEVYHDLTQTDITCLVKNSRVVAGTAVGGVLLNQGDRWFARNQGLINVDEKLLILDRLQPQFTTRRYGDSGYAQLSLTCAPEIRTGAEDGSEMGAFNYLQQPQREAALRGSLEEYIRFGLELGIFYIT